MKNNIIGFYINKEYSFYVDKVLERSKIEIFNWFGKETPNIKIKTFIYKDIPSLVEGLRKRGHINYPDYMVACMIDEDQEKSIERSINLFEPQVDEPDPNKYSRKEYNIIIFHELIHYITDYLYGKLPEWITEGIAKYLDGSYKNQLEEIIKRVNTYQIPDINSMCDTNFVKYDENSNKIYDGYEISFLMINYILEVYGKEYFLTILTNKEFIKEHTEKYLKESLEYYNFEYSPQKKL